MSLLQAVHILKRRLSIGRKERHYFLCSIPGCHFNGLQQSRCGPEPAYLISNPVCVATPCLFYRRVRWVSWDFLKLKRKVAFDSDCKIFFNLKLLHACACTRSLCCEEESVRVSLDVVARCTNRPPLFQAPAGLVTGQIKTLSHAGQLNSSLI